MFDEQFVDGVHYFSSKFDSLDLLAFESFKREMGDILCEEDDKQKMIMLHSYIAGFNSGRKYTIMESN